MTSEDLDDMNADITGSVVLSAQALQEKNGDVAETVRFLDEKMRTARGSVFSIYLRRLHINGQHDFADAISQHIGWPSQRESWQGVGVGGDRS